MQKRGKVERNQEEKAVEKSVKNERQLLYCDENTKETALKEEVEGIREERMSEEGLGCGWAERASNP